MADNVSTYAPTRNGRKLAAAMLDPESLNWTIAELSAKVGIAERTYYRLLADPLFKAWVNEERRQAVFRHMDPVIKAAVKTAAIDGRDGHQDRKMLLEMAGLYQPRQSMEVGGSGGMPLTIIIGGQQQDKGPGGGDVSK